MTARERLIKIQLLVNDVTGEFPDNDLELPSKIICILIDKIDNLEKQIANIPKVHRFR